LNNIYTALRDNGLLVDIHPTAQHKTLKYQEAGCWNKIGEVERTDDIFTAIQSGEELLKHTVETGLFRQMTSFTFNRVDYVESVTDWKEYLKRRRTRGFVGDEHTLQHALQRLEADDECLRVHSEYQVATYTKLNGPRATLMRN